MSSTLDSEADAAAGGHSVARNKNRSTPSIPSNKNKRNKNDNLSKRQRRQQPNPSNTWPQQPKITSAEARAKAYLRVAGLSNTAAAAAAGAAPSSSFRLQPPLDVSLDLHSPEMRFGRLLGGPEQRTRHKAVTQLRAYLKGRCDVQHVGLSEMDLLKLWKGLWHALYLADKVPVQEELAKRLSELLWCVAGTEEEDEYAAQVYLDMCQEESDEEDDATDDEDGDDEDVVMEEIVNTIDQEEEEDDDDDDESSEEIDNDNEGSSTEEFDENTKENDKDENDVDVDDTEVKHCRGAHLAALFVKTFFRTVQREWGNMDKHRIDKFYTLLRLMLSQIFKYMAKRHWNRGIIYLFNDTIRDEVLFQVPNGLRFHLIDITIAELAKVNAEAPMPLTEATFMDCLDPYFALAQHVHDKLVHARAMENVFRKFLYEYSVVSDVALRAEEQKDKVVQGADLLFDQVHVGTVASFIFEIASDARTQDRHRKDLYDLYKSYMKRLKKVGKDVVLDSELGSIDDAEVLAEYTIDDDNNDDGVDADEITNEDRDKVEGPVAQKHKRGRRDETEAVEVTPTREEEPKKPKRKKRRKHKKKASIEQDAARSDVVESREDLAKKADGASEKVRVLPKVNHDKADKVDEEVITISYQEQKDAARAQKEIAERNMKKEKKRKRNDSPRTPVQSAKSPVLSSDEKRVKFGKLNYSKSFKASMKALKTMEPPSTASKTPDRSILRNQEK